MDRDDGWSNETSRRLSDVSHPATPSPNRSSCCSTSGSMTSWPEPRDRHLEAAPIGYHRPPRAALPRSTRKWRDAGGEHRHHALFRGSLPPARRAAQPYQHGSRRYCARHPDRQFRRTAIALIPTAILRSTDGLRGVDARYARLDDFLRYHAPIATIFLTNRAGPGARFAPMFKRLWFWDVMKHIDTRSILTACSLQRRGVPGASRRGAGARPPRLVALSMILRRRRKRKNPRGTCVYSSRSTRPGANVRSAREDEAPRPRRGASGLRPA